MDIDLIGWLTEPFQYGFMVRALLALLLIGVVCPLVGLFVVTRGYGFMGDALAHSVFPGMVGAIVLGFSAWFGAIPTAVAFAIIVGYVTRRTGLRADAAIAIMFATLFALGAIMISVFRTQVAVDLEAILLGQLLAVSSGDLAIMTVLTVATVAYVLWFYPQLVFSSFDPEGAEVAGLRTTLLDYGLLTVISIVVVLTAQAVGVILVLALLVAPAAAATLTTRRHVGAILVGMAFAIAASVVGLYLSYYANWPSGPSIALLTGIAFGVVALVRRRVA